MLLLKVFTLLVLLVIFVQDLLSRSVYWVLFPVLLGAFIALRRLAGQTVAEIWPATVINVCFLLLVVLLLTAWFSFKAGGWVNITAQLLGWGDILFLAACAFYFSVLNFFCFYIFSLVGVLVFWFLAGQKKDQIPLAGFQALILMTFLIADWWFLRLNLTADDWLLRLITR